LRQEYKPQVPFGKLRAGFRFGRRGDLAQDERGGLKLEVSHPFARKKAKGWGAVHL
jgi:hypothetical protein